MTATELRSAAGTRLHVETFGPQDAPTVVLVHGWACSIEFWAPVVERLARDHRVVAYDQRGHGRSEAAPNAAGCSTGALADDLVTVLGATVPAGQRAVIAGHSMGGMTLMAAAGRPELREKAAALLLASTGSGNLAAEARVLPVPGRAARRAAHRALLTGRCSRPRCRSARSTPPARPWSSTRSWGRAPHRPRSRVARGSCTAPPGCPARTGAGSWPASNSTGTCRSWTSPPACSTAPGTG
ncbi:alpha/beta fold hydrolase [Kitasatospora sp. NPDC048365]|uniref:alpha/beta fold hydrolase n=1 Tax=Kitasatospora sp. NPDC048365 TaxID=3364050 RepID=UPI00371A1798